MTLYGIDRPHAIEQRCKAPTAAFDDASHEPPS
jgi:hypothetical protein